MTWSYRRRIKILPGVHLNFSKSGISTSIGVRGASITLTKKGNYINTGIPGTGIYSRKKISGFKQNSNIGNKPNLTLVDVFSDADRISSGLIDRITSAGLQGIIDTISLVRQHKQDLNNDLLVIGSSIKITKFKLLLSYIFISLVSG